MKKSIEVEVLDLTGCDPDLTHVFINVNIGKMPPHLVHDYLKRVEKGEMAELIVKLKRRGYTISLVACSADHTKAVDVEYKVEPNINIEVPEFDLATESFDCAMDIVK